MPLTPSRVARTCTINHSKSWISRCAGWAPIGKIRRTVGEVAELPGEDFAELVYRTQAGRTTEHELVAAGTRGRHMRRFWEWLKREDERVVATTLLIVGSFFVPWLNLSGQPWWVHVTVYVSFWCAFIVVVFRYRLWKQKRTGTTDCDLAGSLDAALADLQEGKGDPLAVIDWVAETLYNRDPYERDRRYRKALKSRA